MLNEDCNTQEIQTSKKPQSEKIIRFLDYLQKIASSRSKIVYDVVNYKQVLWLGDIPTIDGCYSCLNNDRSGLVNSKTLNKSSDVIAEIKIKKEPIKPALVPICEDWIEFTTTNGVPVVRRSISVVVEASINQPNSVDINNNIKETDDTVSSPDSDEHIVLDDNLFVVQENDGSQGSALQSLDTEMQTLKIEEFPEIEKECIAYVSRYEQWIKESKEYNAINAAYTKLFNFRQDALKLGEEYETVLGLGLLGWAAPNGTNAHVNRHVIIGKAELVFDAKNGVFRLLQPQSGFDFRHEFEMLEIEDQPIGIDEKIKESTSSLNERGLNERLYIEDTLQTIVRSLSSQGTYHDVLMPETRRFSANPCIEFAPALILRKKSEKGLYDFLSTIKNNIAIAPEVSPAFATLMEIDFGNENLARHEDEASRVKFDGEIYFPKPSNDAQRQIVVKLKTGNKVLVQGPPGTGKSHTIANLASHLLATGQRVLITAKTSRALKVLEKLLPDELRPMCVNFLGGGVDEYRALESSINGILSKNESFDLDLSRSEIGFAESKLDELRRNKTSIENDLRLAKVAETSPVSILNGVYSGTATQIANLLNSESAAYDWFTDRNMVDVNNDSIKQFAKDALQYYRSLSDAEINKILYLPIPVIDGIEDIKPDMEERSRLQGKKLRLNDCDQEIYNKASMDKASYDQFYSNITELESLKKQFKTNSNEEFLNAVLKIADKAILQRMNDSTKDAIRQIEDLDTVTSFFIPEYICLNQVLQDAEELFNYYKNGGTSGWGIFRSKIVKKSEYLYDKITVNNQKITGIEGLEHLISCIKPVVLLKNIWSLWDGYLLPPQGSVIFQYDLMKRYSSCADQVLGYSNKLDTVQEQIENVGYKASDWFLDNWETCVLHVLNTGADIQRIEDLNYKLKKIENSLESVCSDERIHETYFSLLSAIKSGDVDMLENLLSRYAYVVKTHSDIMKIKSSADRLNESCPLLAQVMQNDLYNPAWENRIENIEKAISWALGKTWISEYVGNDQTQIQYNKTRDIDEQINKTVAHLASLKAWEFTCTRLKEEHCSHMQAWQNSMRKLGKGTGKNANRHRREAQEHLNQCKDAVPAWVLPLNKVWDTITPCNAMFDVVIVDEASQCGMESLPLYYIAKNIIIVGDDKQISPEAVGIDTEKINRFADELLNDFKFKSTFDITSSLFDHGKQRDSNQRVTLREHFRCMPEIIRFSNDLCYRDTPLIPLKQYSSNRLKPLEKIYVADGYREGKNSNVINRPEAKAVVDRIIQICNDERYEDKSIGVITLQGNAQADLIQSMLLEAIGVVEFEKRRLMCGNAYSFQGDERDIIIMSMVAASNDRNAPQTKNTDMKRYNVAASRGKEQLILYHSVLKDELNNECLRYKLLDFFDRKYTETIYGIDKAELEKLALYNDRTIDPAPTPFDSWFEVDVALDIARKGYNIIPQFNIAGRRIDIVVESKNIRLAVECDGDFWHGPEQFESDMSRQRQLERCGWEFFRIRSSSYYANKSTVLAKLWSCLERKGIFPV